MAKSRMSKDKNHLSAIKSMRQRQCYVAPGAKKLPSYLLATNEKTTVYLLLTLMMASVQVINAVNDMTQGHDEKLYEARYADKLRKKLARRPRVIKDVVVEKQVQAICENKALKAFNKPNVVIGAVRDKPGFVLQSCLEDNVLECNRERAIYKRFAEKKPSDEVIANARDGVVKANQAWMDRVFERSFSMLEQMEVDIQTHWQVLTELLKSLSELNSMHLKSNSLVAGIGNCGEFAEHTISTLYKKLEKNVNKLKIQQVIFINTKAADSSHVFLLINSNADDGVTVGELKVKQHLRRIDSGMICDMWNEGYYSHVLDNVNELYKSAGWNKMEIRTISYDFSAIASLPVPVATYLCEEIDRMGYSALESGCGLFAKKVDQQVVHDGPKMEL